MKLPGSKHIMSLLSLFLPLLLAACSGGGTGNQPRTYALGFTDFPHAMSAEAQVAAWSVIENDADMSVMHFDDGVPWIEALSLSEYHPNYMAALTPKVDSIPAGHVTYLAVTPLSFDRSSLALYRGAQGNEPLIPPWDSYGFHEPDMITAFTNHCETMIALFDPDYFAYAIEANMLATATPASWGSFVAMASSVYTSLKTTHPDLPVFVTIQADYFHAALTTQTAAISQILPFTDLIAVSTYPFMNIAPVATIPYDHFSAVADLAPEKPFAVAETCWPAEDVMGSIAGTTIYATEQDQEDYVDFLLDEADALDARFVTWFVSRDFDDLWDSYFQYLPEGAIARIWKDTGLYDGEGNARMGLSAWRNQLDRPRY